MNQEEFISHSPEETQDFAKKLLEQLEGRNVFALIGDLGSGKTAFSQGIGNALNVKRHLQSPTFTIVKEYELSEGEKFEKLYHIDLYRLEGNVDITQIGLDEMMFDKKNLVIIEWAEKMEQSLPDKRVQIHFEYLDDTKRKIVWKIQ